VRHTPRRHSAPLEVNHCQFVGLSCNDVNSASHLITDFHPLTALHSAAVYEQFLIKVRVIN